MGKVREEAVMSIKIRVYSDHVCPFWYDAMTVSLAGPCGNICRPGRATKAVFIPAHAAPATSHPCAATSRHSDTSAPARGPGDPLHRNMSRFDSSTTPRPIRPHPTKTVNNPRKVCKRHPRGGTHRLIRFPGNHFREVSGIRRQFAGSQMELSGGQKQ